MRCWVGQPEPISLDDRGKPAYALQSLVVEERSEEGDVIIRHHVSRRPAAAAEADAEAAAGHADIDHADEHGGDGDASVSGRAGADAAALHGHTQSPQARTGVPPSPPEPPRAKTLHACIQQLLLLLAVLLPR